MSLVTPCAEVCPIARQELLPLVLSTAGSAFHLTEGTESRLRCSAYAISKELGISYKMVQARVKALGVSRVIQARRDRLA